MNLALVAVARGMIARGAVARVQRQVFSRENQGSGLPADSTKIGQFI